VRGLLIKQYFFPEPVATVLAALCTDENQLPQGAPTSPVLSNMLCAGMDRDLHALARSHEAWFTRYADDITISTRQNDFPAQLAHVVFENGKRFTMIGPELHSVIRSHGFTINQDKVWLKGRDRRQVVTGIIVNDGVNVPRRFVRRIRAMMHSWEQDPARAAALFADKDQRRTYQGAQVPDFLDVVRGMIEYVGMVKGRDDPVYQGLLNRYEKVRNAQSG
jgi:RNA-directed DNA polymerase